MKRLRFSKKDLNIWVETEDGDLKLIKVPFKFKSDLIKNLIIKNPLPKEKELVLWLSDFKGYTLDI